MAWSGLSAVISVRESTLPSCPCAQGRLSPGGGRKLGCRSPGGGGGGGLCRPDLSESLWTSPGGGDGGICRPDPLESLGALVLEEPREDVRAFVLRAFTFRVAPQRGIAAMSPYQLGMDGSSRSLSP